MKESICLKTTQKPRPGNEMVHGRPELVHMLNAKNENLKKNVNRKEHQNVYINPTNICTQHKTHTVRESSPTNIVFTHWDAAWSCSL